MAWPLTNGNWWWDQQEAKRKRVLKVFVFVIFYTKWFSCYIKLFEGMAVSVSKEGEPSEKSFVTASGGCSSLKSYFFHS